MNEGEGHGVAACGRPANPALNRQEVTGTER